MKLPVPVYGAVPPVAETETVVVPPLHRMLPEEAEALTADGSLIETEVVAEQPAASVTVKVYEPAVRVKLPVPE